MNIIVFLQELNEQIPIKNGHAKHNVILNEKGGLNVNIYLESEVSGKKHSVWDEMILEEADYSKPEKDLVSEIKISLINEQ